MFSIDRMCSLYPYSTGTLQDLPPPYTPREGVERSGGELEVSRMNFGGHFAKSASPCSIHRYWIACTHRDLRRADIRAALFGATQACKEYHDLEGGREREREGFFTMKK